MDTSPKIPPGVVNGGPPVHWTVEQQLLHYIAERDIPCPLCGYNLRALTVPRCPECGREITLGVRLVEPYLRAWVTLAVALLASAGPGLFLALLLMLNGRLPGRNGPFTDLLGFGFIAAIPLGALVLLTRRSFLRLSRPVQWLLAVAAAAICLTAFVLFCLTAI